MSSKALQQTFSFTESSPNQIPEYVLNNFLKYLVLNLMTFLSRPKVFSVVINI